MLPNFFVVGAQKSGTTSLHNYLKGHPEIYLPAEKETKFFVDDERYVKGITYYESRYFSAWDGEKAVGEVDPDYMYFHRAIERMALNFNMKQIKFIFILRNPVDRAFSHYLMTYRRGLETLSFEKALFNERKRIKKDYRSKMHYSYFHRGLYFRQIKRFLKYGIKSHMLFLLTKDLREKPLECLKKCFEFLDISSDYIPKNINQKYHSATIPKNVFLATLAAKDSVLKTILRFIVPSRRLRSDIRMRFEALNQKGVVNINFSNELREMLLEMYKEENHHLSELIEQNLEDWEG